jgi:hypothetical protein
MHDDLEYRVMLARALREAGASFDAIAEVLKARTRIAQQRERLQSSPKLIHELQIARHRQDALAGAHHRNGRCQQIGVIPVASHTHARNPVQKVKRGASIPVWLNGLDMRIANALLRAGFGSAEEVREAIAKGKAIDRVKARRISVIEAWLQAAR